MNNLTTENTIEYEKQINEDKIKNLPDKEQLAIGICSKAFCIGGNWGYLTEDDVMYKDVVRIIGQGTNKITLYKVQNGVIVLCDRNYFKDAVNYVVPEAIDQIFIDRIKRIQEEERIKFDNFIDSILTGESKYLKKRNNYRFFILGAFCMNETNIIRLNEIEYPAYKLSLKYILARFIKKNEKHKRNIGIKVIENNKSQIIPLNAETLKFTNAIYNGLQIASSKTGAFVTMTIY